MTRQVSSLPYWTFGAIAFALLAEQMQPALDPLLLIADQEMWVTMMPRHAFQLCVTA